MRIDYDSARQNAKKLRALSESCTTAAKTCRRCQDELPLYWKGSAADAYARGLDQLRRQNTTLAGDIEQLAAIIDMVANRMEQEDRNLAAKIAARGSGGAAKAVSSASSAASVPSSAASSAAGAQASQTAKDNISTLASQALDLVSKLFGKG